MTTPHRRPVRIVHSPHRPERAQRLLVTLEAPDDPHALEARIRHALSTGRLEKAGEMVERLRRTGGGRGLAALAEGELLLSRGKTRRAIPRLEEAMELLGDQVRPRVSELLRTHRRALDSLVDALLKRETLDEQEILTVTGLPPATPLPGAPLPSVRETAEPASRALRAP